MSDETKTIPSAGRLKRRTKPVSEQPITDDERAELDDPRLAKPKTTARLGMSITATPGSSAVGPPTTVASNASSSEHQGARPDNTRVAEKQEPRPGENNGNNDDRARDVTARSPKRERGRKSPSPIPASASTAKLYRRVGFTLNADARQRLVAESDDYGSHVAVVIAKVIDAHESGRIDEIYARHLPSSKTNARVAALLPSTIRLPRQSQAGKPRLQIKILESTLEALEEMMGRPELSFASRLTAIVEDAYHDTATTGS